MRLCEQVDFSFWHVITRAVPPPRPRTQTERYVGSEVFRVTQCRPQNSDKTGLLLCSNLLLC